jgi:uncharacterized protein with NRDE domain
MVLPLKPVPIPHHLPFQFPCGKLILGLRIQRVTHQGHSHCLLIKTQGLIFCRLTATVGYIYPKHECKIIMCLLLFSYQTTNMFPVVLLANRDEFHSRPTAPMHVWDDHPDILGGRDLKQGGTWFAVHKSGRFAALTNYRNPAMDKTDAPSRGQIIIDFLLSKEPAEPYLKSHKSDLARFNGFNLVCGDRDQLFWYSSKNNTHKKIPPGIHGLSNQDLNTPWPKVKTGKAALERALRSDGSIERFFTILSDTTLPKDQELPDTGVGLEWERLLSPIFIQNPVYGTRSSLVMQIDHNGTIHVTERTHPQTDTTSHHTDQNFSITAQDYYCSTHGIPFLDTPG